MASCSTFVGAVGAASPSKTERSQSGASPVALSFGSSCCGLRSCSQSGSCAGVASSDLDSVTGTSAKTFGSSSGFDGSRNVQPMSFMKSGSASSAGCAVAGGGGAGVVSVFNDDVTLFNQAGTSSLACTSGDDPLSQSGSSLIAPGCGSAGVMTALLNQPCASSAIGADVGVDGSSDVGAGAICEDGMFLSQSGISSVEAEAAG